MVWLALLYPITLWIISWWAGYKQKSSDLDTFYLARRRGHWLWVSYSMIGTALSGLTFLSLPGSVRTDSWTYLQVVLGYLVGYVGVAYVLLPLYYAHARASVYEYFRQRLGASAEKAATVFFLLSRAVGSSLRLFLALWVLRVFLPPWPFPLWGFLAVALILTYTARRGIATLIYTDFFQTTVFLGAAAFTLYVLWQQPIAGCFASPKVIETSSTHAHFWLKDFLAGALIAFSMTGLDQDQMQKNLSLPTLREAQRNLLLYGTLLLPVNALFLFLGSSLWAWWACVGGATPLPDEAFVGMVQRFTGLLPVIFVLGVVAAALSSADGTLAALTTVTLRNLLPPRYETIRTKNLVLAAWGGLFALLVWAYTALPREEAILGTFLRFSGYTYGPLLGLFVFSRLQRVQAPQGTFWVLLAALVVGIALEWLLALSLGYASIVWIAGWSVGFLWLFSRAFRA